MTGYSDQVLEEIRARSDIVEIVSQRVPLKRAGADFKACCPFHHEKTPSFIVSPSRRTFHCFGCGAKGDVFKFLMMSDGMTFPEAVKALADRCGMSLERIDDAASRHRKRLLALHEDIAAFYRRCLLETKSAKIAREYLERRKLDAEITEKFRIGFAPDRRNLLVQWSEKHGYSMEEMVEGGFLSPPRSASDSFYDRFHGRLMFPICDSNGHVVAFSGRLLVDSKKAPKYYNSIETPIFRKSRVLYGLSFAKRAITRDPRRLAIVCEGQIDVIRCHSCGFQTAIASQGTAFTSDHVALLKSYADGAILAFDGDAAGMKAAIRTGRLFLAAGLTAQAALLPEGEDPDSFLRDRPKSDFQALLEAPVSLVALHVRAFKNAGGNSIDALSRLTDDLFETIASASKAVIRSYMLQEASELLNIPSSALEKDFEAFLESQERRKAASIRMSGQSSTEASSQTISTISPLAPSGNSSASIPVENGNVATGNSAASLEASAGSTQQAVPTPDSSLNSVTSSQENSPAESSGTKRIRLPETPLVAIADALVKIVAMPSDEHRSIASFVRSWLPPVDTTQPIVRILAAAIDDVETGTNELGDLASSGDAETQAIIEHLARRPSPALQSSLPLIETIREFVSRAWMEHIKHVRSVIDPTAPDGANTRLLLSSTLRSLESAQSWTAREAIIAKLR